jgi:Uma2 family endonuclease
MGENIPQWTEGTPRKIDLTTSRIPDLVGEISDTTLAIDLDEKKQLYADLGMPEYWVINISGQRVLAFQLQENGKYKQCFVSQILTGLPIGLLNTTLKRLKTETNISVASWFAEVIRNL